MLEVPPLPGRVVLLDQDLSHAVTAPMAAAGTRPRYSLAMKLVVHPTEAEEEGKERRARLLLCRMCNVAVVSRRVLCVDVELEHVRMCVKCGV